MRSWVSTSRRLFSQAATHTESLLARISLSLVRFDDFLCKNKLTSKPYSFIKRIWRSIWRYVNHLERIVLLKIPRKIAKKLYSFRPLRRKHPQLTRLGWMMLAAFMFVSPLMNVLDVRNQANLYALPSGAESLLPSLSETRGESLRFDVATAAYRYNQDYQYSVDVAGTTPGPKFIASVGSNLASTGMEITDPMSNMAVKITPKFAMKTGQQDANRLIYPLSGLNGHNVYTFGSIGVKEDIVLSSTNKDALSFKYDLSLPNGTEARLESNGDLAVYGVDAALLGNATAGSEEDAKLLEDARANGAKTTLLFTFPAPVVVEYGKTSSSVKSWFTLEGSLLTLHTEGLQAASYPIAIDPSVYIETAQKLMLGNNESNTDFDVDNELIQKSQTTGARIDSWQTNLAMDEEVWGHATAAAAGYIYRAGGKTEDGSTVTAPIVESSVESLQNSNSTSFTMNMPGTRPAGDLYLALISHDGTGTVTPPSGGGWTEYADLREHAAYYKIGTDQGGGSEAASYTWTGSNEKWGGIIIRVTGFNTSNPISPTPTTNSSGSNSTPVFPAITPTSNNTLIIRAMGADDDEIDDAGWVPSGHTSIGYGGPTGTQDSAYAVASMNSPPNAGNSTGTATMQSGYISDTWGSSTIAINPAPASGSTPTVVDTVEWAKFNSTTLAITSPNPGSGACTGWCNQSDYDLPQARINHSMVTYNGYLYVIGGENSGGTRQSTVYIAKLGANGEPQLWHPTDTNKNNWVYWYTGSLNGSVAKSYLSAVAYNNRLYIVGGQTNASPGGVTTVERADILPNGTLGNWTTTGMQALPSGAGKHMSDVVVYNDTLYAIGGFEGVRTSSSNLRNSVYYSRLNQDGTMNTWKSTSSFTTARANFGGASSYIWGAYIYMGGGCSAVNASGYCTTFTSDMQIASVNADGSLGKWRQIGNLDNTRIGYNFIGWQGGLYRLGGCVSISSSSGECLDALSDVDYGVINPAGEVSTVSISDEIGEGDCTGGSPENCDLPSLGDSAGQGGGMLSSTVILNGYLYVIGGCTSYTCSTSSGNISYAAIGSEGNLQAPATCSGTTSGSWCVDSTNRVNGTSGISAAGITTFNNRIYLIGGIDESTTGVQAVTHNGVNDDGSLDGAWESDAFSSIGVTGEKSYTYAYARANPSTAGTYPGNLYILGGCSSFSNSTGCSSSYNTEVYKCNISTSGSVSSCTTTGQLQIDTELETETNQGLGLHSGTVYANYIFLIGGYSDNVGDRDTVYYAKFDDSNNIVDAVSGTANPASDDDDWILEEDTLSVGRRRGFAFGYNGHIYAVGGYNADGSGTIIPFIEWAKMDVGTGSIDPFVTSSVTINQRWGLSMAVSNAYAYVVGGCDVGASPGSCTSFEPSLQTFQLYNNDSGTPASYTTPTNQFTTDRLGASSVVSNGHIYLAGGCTSTSDCTNATNSVQYAPLDAYGNIGTWSATTANLPADRAWGQLEAAGGSLYYIGGQSDTATDERSEVYYATPGGGYQTISQVQKATNTCTDTDTDCTASVTLTSTVAGNTLIGICTGEGDGGWSDVVMPGFNGALSEATSSNMAQQIFYKTTAGGETSVSCTLNGAGSRTSGYLTVFEYSGLATNPVDVSASRTGSSAFPNTNTTSTTTQPNALLIAGISMDEQNISFSAWTDSFTEESDQQRANPGGGGVGVASRIVSATGAYTTSATPSSVADWIGQIVVFKAAANTGSDITNWSTATHGLPAARRQFSSAVWNDRIYVTGGNNSSGTPTNTIYVSPQLSSGGNITSAWASDTDTFDVARNGHTTIAYANNLYVLGGYDGSNYLTDVQFTQINSDGTLDPWTFSTRLPESIRQGDGFAANGYMYLVGGRTSDTVCRSNTLVAPISANTTIASGNNPTGIGEWNETNVRYSGDRYGNAVAYNDGKLYTLGGACKSTSIGAQYGTYTFDADNDSDESAWTWVSDNGSNGLNSSGTGRAWSHDTNDTPSTDVGPTSGQEGNPDGYVYTEASSPASGGDTFTTTFNTSLDASSYNWHVEFYWNQRGDDNLATVSVQTNEGSGWTTRGTYGSSGPNVASGGTQQWNYEDTDLTGLISSATTQVRFLVTLGNSGNIWNNDFGLDSITLTGYSGSSLDYTGAQRVQQATLSSQPQIAKYSRMIDTDTDVFPTKWLMNGLDNSIGARWTARYRTMTDPLSSGGLGTACSTAKMTTWGQDTNFGDVTLSNPEEYTPLDSSGADTNCARYYYFFISIDASQTFGYPEDVNRGPTIADLSLFYTADPSKRLIHGKTFTGGLQQPNDTPF